MKTVKVNNVEVSVDANFSKKDIEKNFGKYLTKQQQSELYKKLKSNATSGTKKEA